MSEESLFFIGNNVSKLRKAQKLTQDQLALRADLSQSYINQLESGKKGFSRDSLMRVAKALDVSVDSIFEKSSSVKTARSSGKKTGQKGSIIEYVDIKPEPYEVRQKKKKILTNELLELAKILPEDTIEHYFHLMKMEVNALRKKK